MPFPLQLNSKEELNLWRIVKLQQPAAAFRRLLTLSIHSKPGDYSNTGNGSSSSKQWTHQLTHKTAARASAAAAQLFGSDVGSLPSQVQAHKEETADTWKHTPPLGFWGKKQRLLFPTIRLVHMPTRCLQRQRSKASSSVNIQQKLEGVACTCILWEWQV